MGKYSSLAADIIKNVGGKENVESLRHCVTRLRFRLIDESIANDEVIKNMDGVVTVMKAMGEYMVVIGEHVADVYDEVCSQLGLDAMQAENKEQKNAKKKSPLEKVLGTIMGGMGPTLHLLCACGIIKGLLVLLTFVGVKPTDGIYMLMNAAGDCFFYFLPLILGFNFAKKFQIDPFFGLILAAAMCYPAIQNVDINLWGYVVNTTYTSTFLPILFGLLVAVPLYKWFDKVLPKMIKGFMTPMLTLIIIFPLTFIVIGPLANMIGAGLNVVLTSICEFSPLLAGLILGGCWQIFVLFGIHGVLTIFAFMDLLAGNPSQLLAFSYGASFATCGVLLSIILKTKDAKLKEVALPSFISAIFGVTEPGTYGVTLPRKKMFAICCIGGAASGVVVALSNLAMYSYAGMGIIGLLGFVNPDGPNFIGIALSAIVPFVVSFVLGMLVYKDSDYEYLNDVVETDIKSVSKEEKKEEKKEAAPALLKEKEMLAMPADGMIKPLSEAADEAFANEALGKGCLVIPENGNVYAPFDGTVRVLFPTKHAIGLVSEGGCEALIHIGINTVNLDGKYFEAHVQQGDCVKKGQLLVSFEKEKIEQEGYSCEIPVIITNTDEYLDIVEKDHDRHVHGEDMLHVIQ